MKVVYGFEGQYTTASFKLGILTSQDLTDLTQSWELTECYSWHKSS